MATKDLIVVGIGSSAGGLEALQVMLSKITDTLNCSYVIAQHLSPTHRSMMVDLLSRVTNIPVIEVQNGMVIKPKTIYMTPENTDIYASNGKLYLKTIEQVFGPRPSINYFFNSLAQCYGSRTIGVILSGTGSDGAFGIRAIKASGGITIAQSPQSAKYDGMPISAINTGKVDIVAHIDNMASEIARVVSNLGKNVGDSINDNITAQIYRLIFEEKGVDFSQYKKTTLIRRIERRLAALKIETLNDYVDYLKSEPTEVTNLYHDILIGVTEFFRDFDAFEEIRYHIESLISKKEQGEEIRFWIIGCSTGEEAYSFAIMLSEILQDKISKYKVKIFATDIDDEALKIARTGIYAETSLVNVKKEYLPRYFTVSKNQFEVKKSIRELVIFSKHNVISDSPFLRLDFVSCRNMLIYFNNTLQNRFFPIVHYSLKEGGVLLLGKSESIGEHADLFVTVHKQLKIFKTQYTGFKELPKLYNYSMSFKQYDEPKQVIFRNEEEILEEKIIEATSKFILNQCVLINSSNEIVYVKGQIPYLVYSQGRATNNIFKCVKEELVLDIRSALNDVQKNKQNRSTQFRSVEIFGDILKYVRVNIIPIKNEKNDDWFYALFFQSEEIENIKGYISQSDNENETIANLTNELAKTKSHLQNVIEELETSYEEMQSLNEELSSSNEELQSSNEELETTNEELQSTNEELQTAYSELKVLYDDKDNRTKQLEELTVKLQFQTEDLRKQKELTEAIINTTPVAIIMTDTLGKINFANINAQNLFKLSKKDILNRSLDSESWIIKDINNEPFNKEMLPLSLVKKSYESVRNVKYSVQTGENYRVLISVSGSALFDKKGDFIGAVFSVEDITRSQLLQDQIKKYEEISGLELNQKLSTTLNKLNSHDIKESSKEQFNLIQIAMLDMADNLKNSLSELNLVSKALISHVSELKGNDELVNSLNSIMLNMNTMINGNIAYYTSLYSYESVEFVKLVNKSLVLFGESFIHNGIEINNKINHDLHINAVTKDAITFILHLIEILNRLNVDNVAIDIVDDSLVIELEDKSSLVYLNNLNNIYTKSSFGDIFYNKLQNIVVKISDDEVTIFEE